MDTRRREPYLRAFGTKADSNHTFTDQALTGFRRILPTRFLSIQPL